MSQSTLSDNRYAQGIARFVAGPRYEAIPAEVVTRIRDWVLDMDKQADAAELAQLLAKA